MKYIFFGTPRFAEIVLEKLIAAGMPPIAVVCNPDKPVGRKKIITPPPVKARIMNYELGIRNNIKILQPVKITPEVTEEIKSLGADFYIVAAYGKILLLSLLKIPKLGTIGVHPSYLPKFRGSSPIQGAILAGAPKTGVTLYLLDDKVDHGGMLAKSEPIITDGKTYSELEEELAEIAGDTLIDTLPNFEKGRIIPEEQNESEATFTKKFETKNAYIEASELAIAESGNDLEKAKEIYRKILALNPEPGTYTIKNDVRIKLLAAKIVDSSLKLTTIQEAGKTPRFLP